MTVVPLMVALPLLLETTPTQVPAHSSVDAPQMRISVTAGLDTIADPISGQPAAAGGFFAATPSNMSTMRAAALTAMDAMVSCPRTVGVAKPTPRINLVDVAVAPLYGVVKEYVRLPP
jgi:hypothetical protein